MPELKRYFKFMDPANERPYRQPPDEQWFEVHLGDWVRHPPGPSGRWWRKRTHKCWRSYPRRSEKPRTPTSPPTTLTRPRTRRPAQVWPANAEPSSHRLRDIALNHDIPRERCPDIPRDEGCSWLPPNWHDTVGGDLQVYLAQLRQSRHTARRLSQ